MKLTHRLLEIYQSGGREWQRDDRQAKFLGRSRHGADLFPGNAYCFGCNVHAIKADARDMFEADSRRDAGLVECTVDDAEFHASIVILYN